MKTLTLLFLILTLVSCGKSGGGSSAPVAPSDISTAANNESNTGTDVSLEEIAEQEVVPSAALNFDVKVDLTNFNSAQEDKILEASDLIRKVIASDEFKNAILNHKVNGKRRFVDNQGLSNAQIYKKIIEGSEKLKPGKDNEMDLELEVYREASNTVGYTYPSINKVFMNAKFLNRNKPYEVTTNMTHEWLHKLGFKHAQQKTPSRKYSVPYAVGYIMRKLSKKNG